ncbi:response regulator [Aquihabitans sp. G128]|uniref:response regulator n=1 Tax=Aquihabitans sp. G128 TaxID=2849779 RepID=UPI001C245DC5|nr:response regulator [Aquihabitans sp. G128]QXC61797.1 response regulator [Aquihabitans sp. G128]
MTNDPTTSNSSNEPRHVLVVEDDVPLLHMASKILERAGYRVTQARTAEEALLAVRPPARFHLLFTDVVMPGRTGLELASLLRANHPTLGILLTTGQFDAEVRRSVERSGHHVLRKPYTAQDLCDAALVAMSTPDVDGPAT